MGRSPITRTPRLRAYERTAAHSRSNRTWSASEPPKDAQSPLQNGWRATKDSISSSDTVASGSASNPADAAKAERAAYGEPVSSGRSEEHTSELQSHSDLVCR